MFSINLEEMKKVITIQHENDRDQLDVIFSESPRLIVEAPAGYGKTTTMISRIAYLFASGKIPNPKRILALTFSVNAALKIKREVAGKLPLLLGTQSNPVAIENKVMVTNYHGFCKGMLKKYGYLISDALRKDINLFRAISESDIAKHSILENILTPDEIQLLKNIETAIKEASIPDTQSIHAYHEIVIKKLLPLEYITHNAIILFALKIFNEYNEVIKFYQYYFPLIVVDEFQDTNCIAWALLESLISDHTQLLFLGDPLQRIYGFIGALPDIMSKVVDKYGMTKVVLTKNYRFRNNPEMKKLDRNIRANAASYFRPTILDEEVAELPIFWGDTQQEEAEKVVAKVKNLMVKENVKIALLFARRGINAEIVETQLTKNNIPYFYGMFTDEDPDYVEFHIKCQELFIKKFGKSKSINRKALKLFSDSVKTAYTTSENKTVNSLLCLLDALVEKVTIDYADINPEDKYTLILDIFENRQLKQAMEYVDSQVILSTVHGAKGLEWEYVFICDVERWGFTFVCRECPSISISEGTLCKLPQIIPKQIIGTLLNDLCVFYVALTRAKKQAYISASAERYNSKGYKYFDSKICCFALVKGVKLINADPNSSD